MVGMRFTFVHNTRQSSHSEIQQSTITVVVPQDTEYWRKSARLFVDNYVADRVNPDDYKLIDAETFEVHGILQDVTRLEG